MDRIGADVDAGQQLNTLMREYWDWQLREYPELSTWTGDNRYNDRFTDLSLIAIESRKVDEQRMLDEARRIDPSRLSGQDRISHALLLWDLDLAVRAQQFPPVLILNQIWGPQLMFPQLVSVTPFFSELDYNDYLHRLAAFPLYMDQVIGLLRFGIELGWVQPSLPLRGVHDQIEGQLDPEIENNALYKPFLSMPEDIPGDLRSQMKTRARAYIADGIYPAMVKLRDFLTQTYLPAGRQSIAASTLPDGGDYYLHCVREYTTTGLSPADIHQVGLKEVARIRAEMEAIIKEIGFQGTFTEFGEFLRTDPRFYYTKPEDLVTAYRDIAKRADAELPKLFAELPRTPYGVRPFPDYEAPSQTTAMYYPGASDGSRAGYFIVNTYRLDMRPMYEMEALSLHEAVPGHHLQIARAQELTGLPDFRRNASYTAYIEGWALYAESLGSSMGFYTDPYSTFGRLTYEIWRACRLVVDTGMHLFGWTRQEAIDYLKDNTAKTEQDIAVEVDRYIVWPGQALSYKIGELKISELRAKAKAELGSRFDLRRFHNAILDNGPLPLDVLEDEMNEWIRAAKAAGQA